MTLINGKPDHHHILGRYLVLVPTIGTYVEWYYIENINTNNCHHFELTVHTLWSVLVPSNALEGLPSVPCEQGCFFKRGGGWVFYQQWP